MDRPSRLVILLLLLASPAAAQVVDPSGQIHAMCHEGGSWLVGLTQGGNTATVSASGALKTDGSAVTQPVSGTLTCNAGTNLNTSALLTTTAHDAAFGTAGVADTQVRTIQGIASMTPVQVSQATAANLNATVTDGSGPLTVDGTVAATQSGTWTVQPGNTANTTAWKVDGSAVTQPVSGTVTANAGTGSFTVAQATAANLNARTDTSGATAAAVPARADYVGLSDGTNLRGAVAASGTTLTTQTIVGLQLTSSTCTWKQQHTPATATKATISQAAVASTRHVLVAFTACVATGATAQTPITLQIRDGATGAGTIVWSAACAAPVNGSCCVSNTGVPLTGTANTAMTIEWSGAGVTASQETVSMCGFDVT